LFAVRWIADERILELRDDVAKLLEGPQPGTRYYLAVLSAVDWLDHEPSMRGTQIADELLVRELRNEKRSPEAHTLALRHLSPENKFLSHKRLRGYLRSEHKQLRLETVRSLAQQSDAKRFELLAEVAGDKSQEDELRAEAVVGLSADAERYRELLERLADTGGNQSKGEAARALRLAKLRAARVENKPPADDLLAWTKLLKATGDAAAGRRLFFSPIGPRCGICHQFDGRGGRIGPELTYIARSNRREQIIASILQPNREVAPHYQPWSLVTKDGKTLTGLRQAKAGDNGMEDYVDSAGNPFSLPSDAIDERTATNTSIMPDGLQSGMSVDDLRDLIAFLTETK
jgi:putative heme-binding domain-containing protein